MGEGIVASNRYSLIHINGEVFRIDGQTGETMMLDFERYRDAAVGFAKAPTWVRIIEAVASEGDSQPK